MRSPKRSSISLRMTAMIDVIFLLLIFFVLTARFRQPEQFLPIQLPSIQSQLQRLDVIDPLRISIQPTITGCKVLIGSNPVLESVDIERESIDIGLADFVLKLSSVIKGHKRSASDPIEILCHDDIKWDHQVKIYNILYSLGLNDITFDLSRQE